MKVLLAGDWHSLIHEEPVAQALSSLGHHVVRFPWHAYFTSGADSISRISGISKRFQQKYMVGPLFRKLNQDLVRLVAREQPDAVFVYRGTHITTETLDRIRNTSEQTVLIGYNNDDPFSPYYPKWVWRHFIRAIRSYDLLLAYRHRNLEDFRLAGAREVRLLRSWFVPELNYPMALSAEDKMVYGCDVVFVGHYETDFRIRYLDTLAKDGFRVHVHGPDYPKRILAPNLQHVIPIHPVRGEEYNKALAGAKVALCFFSKLNRDTYTRRCFEIPATQTLMLAEHTDDIASLFREGQEADYFRSLTELRRKVLHYVNNDKARESVAKAGYQRCWTDGHDVKSRIAEMMKWVTDIKGINYD